jgi:pimeloyl-ACP methyl ester carboxylesterase
MRVMGQGGAWRHDAHLHSAHGICHYLLLLQLATLVGCSMGAAVIWAHLELFGDARIGKCVFVDQAPLQVQSVQHRLLMMFT